MKVGIEAKFFNLKMVERRKELGLSQKALAELAGITTASVCGIERLRQFNLTIWIVRDKLNKVANVLEMPLEELFPPEYLEMLRLKIAPKKTTFVWSHEVSLERIAAGGSHPVLALPSAEEVYERKDTNEFLSKVFAQSMFQLPDMNRTVLELRFGLGVREHTLEETAKVYSQIFGRSPPITRERVRQIEAKGLRYLRHPRRLRWMRHGLDYPGQIPQGPPLEEREIEYLNLKFVEPQPEPDPVIETVPEPEKEPTPKPVVAIPPPPPEIKPKCACFPNVQDRAKVVFDVCERCEGIIGYIADQHGGGVKVLKEILREWPLFSTRFGSKAEFGYIAVKASCCDLNKGHYTVHLVRLETQDGGE